MVVAGVRVRGAPSRRAGPVVSAPLAPALLCLVLWTPPDALHGAAPPCAPPHSLRFALPAWRGLRHALHPVSDSRPAGRRAFYASSGATRDVGSGALAPSAQP